jgi:hypothetical protein
MLSHSLLTSVMFVFGRGDNVLLFAHRYKVYTLRIVVLVQRHVLCCASIFLSAINEPCKSYKGTFIKHKNGSEVQI